MKTFSSDNPADLQQLDNLLSQVGQRAKLGRWTITTEANVETMRATIEITGPTVSGTYRPAEEAIPATEPTAPANLPAEPPAIVEAAAVPAEASPAADVVVEDPVVVEIPPPDPAMVEKALEAAAANDGGTIDEILAPEAVTPKRKKKASNGE